MLRRRVRIQPSGLVAGLFLAFVTWAALSCTWAVDPTLTLKRTIELILLLTFAAGLTALLRSRSPLTIRRARPRCKFIPGVMAELQWNNFHPFAAGHRFGGTVHPNLQGASLALAIIVVSCWVWRSSRRRQRARLAAANVVLILFLLMTGSRTSMAALVAALGVLVVLLLIRSWRRGTGLKPDSRHCPGSELCSHTHRSHRRNYTRDRQRNPC